MKTSTRLLILAFLFSVLPLAKAALGISITCSSNIVATATSSNGAVVFYTVTASGGCNPPPNVVANPPSGSTFPIGITTVTARAADSCGNSNTCSFTVTVNPPTNNIVIQCSSNIVTTASGPGGATVFYTVTASGGCNPPVSLVANPASGSTFPIGITVVTAVARDTCGNSNTCSFSITVNAPTNIPTIQCPTNIVTTAPGPGGATVFYTVTASGGCSPPPSLVANPPSGSTFPIGTTLVTATATDSCGNSNMCSFQVTVNPPTNTPTIQCSTNIVTTATSSNGAVVFYTVTASGGCSPPPNLVANPPSGSTFPIGTTLVTANATDTCGNSNTCSFTVTVNAPTNPPINLTCSTNITVTATSSNGAVVFFNVSATGGCNPPPAVIATPPSGSTFPIGTTMVFVTATNSCGQTTNCSFQVTVNAPTNPPINLTCSTNITATATSSNGAVVFFNVSATGGCNPPPMVIATPPSGSTFPIGTTVVFVTATNSCGQTTNCSFQVTVNAQTNPPINLTCSTNITVTATSSNGAVVFFNVSATGGCNPPPAVIATPPSGSTFPIGTNPVLVTATNSCGQTTNCSFQVIVNAQTNPPINLTCSTNITTVATSSNGAVVSFNVSATGGCNPPPTVIATPPSGSTFPIGTNTVLVTATNGCGQTTNCSFQVLVTNRPINLMCSSNITVAATGSNGAVVFFSVSATGGCSPPPSVVANPTNGSTFAVGTTMVNVTASDTCGQTTNCSFTVTVTNVPVTITCPSNIFIMLFSQTSTNVSFTVTASGGCSGTPTVTSTPINGSVFQLGTTVVTNVATDSCGASNFCTFNVTIQNCTNYGVPNVINTSTNPAIFECWLTATNVTVTIGTNNNVQASVYMDDAPANLVPQGVVRAPPGLPAPMIRLNVGQTFICHFKNNLNASANTEGASIHWHGIEDDNDSDGTGVTQDTVYSNQTYLYRFDVPRAGLYWYHSHMLPANTTFAGMYGPLIVTSNIETSLISSGVLPPANYTFPLAMGDINFNPSNGFVGATLNSNWMTINTLAHLCEVYALGESTNKKPCGAAGTPGPIVMVNGNTPSLAGTIDTPGSNSTPRFYVPSGQKVRLQLFSEALSRDFCMTLLYPTNRTGDTNLYRIGGQGGLLDNVILEGGVQSSYDFQYPFGQIDLGSGMRADVMFNASGTNGDVIQLVGIPLASQWQLSTPDVLPNGTNYPIAFFVITTNLAATTNGPPLTNGAPILAGTMATNYSLKNLPTNSLLVPPCPGLGTANPTITLQNGRLSNATNDVATNNGPTIGGYAAFQLDGNTGYGSWTNVTRPPTTLYAHVGDVLELTIANITGQGKQQAGVHPYHLHGFSMQPIRIVSAANPATILYTYPYNEFLDTIEVYPNEALVFRIRVDDRPILHDTGGNGPVTILTQDSPTGGALGRWLMHCHIFLHAGIGMIDELDVITNFTPITLTCPADIDTVASSAQGNQVFFSGNASGGYGPLTITYSPTNGSVFPIGTNTVTTTATDGYCTNTCSFTITVVPPDQTLTINPAAGGGPGNPTNAVISWSGPWILQSATRLTGPWTNVSGATSPFTTPANQPTSFYRLVLPQN